MQGGPVFLLLPDWHRKTPGELCELGSGELSGHSAGTGEVCCRRAALTCTALCGAPAPRAP